MLLVIICLLSIWIKNKNNTKISKIYLKCQKILIIYQTFAKGYLERYCAINFYLKKL